MLSSFVFLGLIAVIASSVSVSKNQTPPPAKNGEKLVCNCNYNVNRDSHVSKAIKELQAKMEHLIALVNKTSPPPPQPTTPTGKQAIYLRLPVVFLTALVKFMHIIFFSGSRDVLQGTVR